MDDSCRLVDLAVKLKRNVSCPESYKFDLEIKLFEFHPNEPFGKVPAAAILEYNMFAKKFVNNNNKPRSQIRQTTCPLLRIDTLTMIGLGSFSSTGTIPWDRSPLQLQLPVYRSQAEYCMMTPGIWGVESQGSTGFGSHGMDPLDPE